MLGDFLTILITIKTVTFFFEILSWISKIGGIFIVTSTNKNITKQISESINSIHYLDK